MLDRTYSMPRITVPAHACDCHMHVFGPLHAYPPAARRTYTPVPAPLPAYLKMARTLGLERVVFVQPSAYGADNRCLLDAMAQIGSAARGIIGLDETITDDALLAMNACGVRGVRLNMASRGARDIKQAQQMIRRVFGRVSPLGWHIQMFVDLDVVIGLTSVLRDLPIPFVFDHMALARAAFGTGQSGFRNLCDLLASGACWVKLSGADRISRNDRAEFEDALPIMRELIAANPEQLVWGTDWPHTGKHGHAENSVPPPIEYRPLDTGRLLDLLAEAAPDQVTLTEILVNNPARLYGYSHSVA